METNKTLKQLDDACVAAFHAVCRTVSGSLECFAAVRTYRAAVDAFDAVKGHQPNGRKAVVL